MPADFFAASTDALLVPLFLASYASSWSWLDTELLSTFDPLVAIVNVFRCVDITNSIPWGFNTKGMFKSMEKFNISVSGADGVFSFQVVNNGTEKCEYEVFAGEQLVAVFEPDEDEYIHICRNPGGLGEEIIYMIAGQFEQYCS